MDNQLIRVFILVVLVFLLTTDMKDLLSTTSTFGPYLPNSWRSSKGKESSQGRSSNSRNSVAYPKQKWENSRGRGQNLPHALSELDTDWDKPTIKVYKPNPEFINERLKKTKIQIKPVQRKRINPDDIFASLSEEEKKELLSMRTQMTKVMQEWCLPKLVCELYASIGGDRSSSLSEAEQSLLTIIRDTNMAPSVNAASMLHQYQFASHMGQLLANVEGNGCHNFYPNCPLSGPKVLQMVKRVKFK